MIAVLLRRFGLVAFAALAAAAPVHGQAEDPAATVAVENARLRDEIADATGALARAQAEVARLRKSKAGLEAGMRRIEERAEVHVLGREFSRAMMEQLRRLPAPEQYAHAREQRRQALAATGDASLDVERRMGGLADLAAAAAIRLADGEARPAPSRRAGLEADLNARLAEQRDLLTHLHGLQIQVVKVLREAGAAEVELERASEAARTTLTRLLFWVPAPPGWRTLSELGPSLAWTLAPANWRAAGANLLAEAARRPFWPAAAVLLAVGLLAARGRLQRRLVALAPDAVTPERYRAGHSLKALAITLALSLPGPIVLWTAGALLAAAPQDQRFTLALGDTLDPVARLVLLLSVFAWLFDRRGVAVRHFGWDEAWVTFVSRALRRFALVFVPLIVVTGLNGREDAPFANRESLGRLGFDLAMIALAVLLFRLFRRASPPMQRLRARAPRSWPVQLHAVWFGALVALPLGVAALGAAGYLFAAGYFFGRGLESMFFVLGAVMLYGLVALWVRIGRARLVRLEGAGAAAARLDPADIGEQTRSLLDVLVTLLLLGGLWWLWQDALPALQVIGDYALWTYNETVNGKEVTHPLTVRGLFLALVILGVTAVGVRNVGALLDLALLQRLDLQADVTYAAKIVARYIVAGVGVVAAAGILGVGWSDVQWLIAALGVGLGFGLGEIFSNLVSGLIVLVERPIRIGDVVTVGDVSGTVSRIGARATAVTDFDNKEVLIPNKSFVTDRLINWTLSNQVTRLLIKFSVARESDMAQVQRVAQEAVSRTADVLREPPPAVFFAGFGAKSLDFEIHAYVGSFAKRQGVQHEINAAVDRALRASGIPLA